MQTKVESKKTVKKTLLYCTLCTLISMTNLHRLGLNLNLILLHCKTDKFSNLTKICCSVLQEKFADKKLIGLICNTKKTIITSDRLNGLWLKKLNII